MNISDCPTTCAEFLNCDNIRIFDVFFFSRNTEEFHKYLRVIGLLGISSGPCGSCNIGTFKYVSDGHSSHTGEQRFFWRCSNYKCRKKISYKEGSFFSKAKLSERAIFLIIFYFVHGYSQQNLQRDLGLSAHSTVGWYNFCRNVSKVRSCVVAYILA